MYKDVLLQSKIYFQNSSDVWEKDLKIQNLLWSGSVIKEACLNVNE
jgi:hypothetical protein